MVRAADSFCADDKESIDSDLSRRSVAASRTESTERELVESSARPAKVVVAWPAGEVGTAIAWDGVATVAENHNEFPPPKLARGVVTVAVLLYAE